MLPKKLTHISLKAPRFFASDWFSTTHIEKDNYFVSTQPADTNIVDSLSFCEELKFVDIINNNSSVRCVITNEKLRDKLDRRLGIIISKNPKLDFFHFHNKIAKNIENEPLFGPRIESTAEIHSTAYVEDNCYIGHAVCVGPGARILRNSYIDKEVIIGPNVVIGSEGLEFRKQEKGSYLKIIHIGGVYLGPKVEIMANSVICKNVYLGFTEIASGTKIGPLCDVAHRTTIGENCLIAGNSTIGGSAKIGSFVWIGPSATISDGVRVGDYARVHLGSVVAKDVKQGQKVSGIFAIDHLKALKEYAYLSSEKK